MPCLHRFHQELLPSPGMEYLFIGTFNPIWKVKKGEDPDYFYSRSGSLFWCILPHAFNQNCLIDKDRKEKEQFCRDFKVGLTDLIYCIDNVDESDEKHKEFLTSGFKDEDFEKVRKEKLKISYYTDDIKKYISNNKETLKRVFFTRKTKQGVKKIWNEWLEIKELCEELGVSAVELSSPSPRGGGIRDKIFKWRKAIESAK